MALIDRREFPRFKLCGGLLTWKTGQELKRVFGPGALDGVVDFEPPRFEIRHWDQVLAAGSGPHPFRLVKRRVKDQRILDLARNILPELRAANRLRWVLFEFLRWPGPRGLAGLLRLLQNPLAQAVHGLRSYGLMRPKRWGCCDVSGGCSLGSNR